MLERNIQAQIMMAASRAGVVIFRNNVGVAVAITPRPKGSWTALMQRVVRVVKELGGYAAPIKYGLHEGSSDLIGWRSVTITPDMVGKQVAQFVSLEVKTATGALRPEQLKWLVNVQGAGGIGAVVRSPEEAVAACNPLF